MTTGLDTSVVLRLLLGHPVDQAAQAVAWLDRLSRQGHAVVVSDLVVAETYFALQHHYGVSKMDALVGLRRLFADGEIRPLGVAAKMLAQGLPASVRPGFVDRLIHGAYTSAADEMVTFERAAGRMKSVRVLWGPIRDGPPITEGNGVTEGNGAPFRGSRWRRSPRSTPAARLRGLKAIRARVADGGNRGSSFRQLFKGDPIASPLPPQGGDLPRRNPLARRGCGGGKSRCGPWCPTGSRNWEARSLRTHHRGSGCRDLRHDHPLTAIIPRASHEMVLPVSGTGTPLGEVACKPTLR